MMLSHGALLYDRYRIVEILGQGSRSTVYRAVDEKLGIEVIVKENLSQTDGGARQFRLEAVILANLQHPNLPRGTDHFLIEDQGQYLVMDYIEGEDLSQRIERTGTITDEDAILIGTAICDVLTYLHTRNPPIVHRNLQPENIRITSDGHVFLTGFGLAKVLHGDQTAGREARTDARTDIYSLGATLYASLSGRVPEDGLARAMGNAQLTPLRKHNPKTSRRLAVAIEKAMAVDPADRFQTAEDFRRALLDMRKGFEVHIW